MKFTVFKYTVILLILSGCNNSLKQSTDSFCKYNVFGEYVYENKDYSMTLSYTKEDDIYGVGISLTTKNNPHKLFFNAITHWERINESKSELFPLPLDSIQPNTFYRFNKIEFVDIELNQGYDLNYNGYVKDFSIRFLGDNQIEFQCKGLGKIVKEFYGVDVPNVIILKKISGDMTCIMLDADISLDKLEDEDFATHIVETNYGVTRLNTEDLYNLCYQPSYYTTSDVLKNFGSVFQLDFNNDGLNDICGYFKDEYKYNPDFFFKIFLNNGFSYNEAFSDIVYSNGIGFELYVPSKSKNKNSLIVVDLHDKPSYCIYWDQLDNKIKEYKAD